MFDKLVESSNQRRDGRTRKAFVVTSLLYAGALTALCITTIVWFNPAMADTAELQCILAPPPVPPSAPPAPQRVVKSTSASVNPNIAPTRIPDRIVEAAKVPPALIRTSVAGAVGPVSGPAGSSLNLNYVPGDNDGDALPPPEPVTRPTPKADPTPTPAPKTITKVSEGVLVGKALHKVSPVYPAIAKAARAQGAVKVQVTIDEDGQVISAAVIEGHPLLRDVSAQAARQWRFSPTLLSREAVKVQGILTFNFTLGQ